MPRRSVKVGIRFHPMKVGWFLMPIGRDRQETGSKDMMDMSEVRASLMELREFFGDNAQRLTCGEIPVLIDLFIGIGEVDTAIDLLLSHAADEEEEEGDEHYGWDEARCALWVADRITEGMNK